jgi:fermentation-respiration switch protein FrsA (DUF1100 family)
LATLLVAGCSPGFLPLNRPALRMTNPRFIVAAKSSTPRFTVNTATVGLAFGIIGALIETSIDQARFHGHMGARDPAIFIRATLVAALAKRFSLEVLDVGPTAKVADDGDGQPDGPPKAPDLVLEITTNEWGLASAPTGGAGVAYEGTLRLRDMRTKKVLAEAVCSSRPVTGESVGELAANNGAGLRDVVRGVAEFCADDYRHRVLGLY